MKMNKNKIIISALVIILVTAFSVSVTACGNSNSQDNHIEVVDIVPE